MNTAQADGLDQWAEVLEAHEPGGAAAGILMLRAAAKTLRGADAPAFVAEKRVAIHSYRKVLTGERVGPYGHDADIVPYLLELNAIPGCYSWASCSGHDDGRRGFVWVALREEPGRVPAQLATPPGFVPVLVVHPFQKDVRKISFEFVGAAELASDMGAVLEYLWGLAL